MSRSQWWGKQSSRCDIVSYCLHRLWMNLDGSLILSRPLRLCSFRSSTYKAVLAGRMHNGPAVLDSGWSGPGHPASRKDDRKKIKSKTNNPCTVARRCKEPRQEYGVLILIARMRGIGQNRTRQRRGGNLEQRIRSQD